MNAAAPIDDGEAVLAEALAAYRAALGPRLLAAYALGSLAHGGFSALVSDVDLAVVLRDPPGTDDPDRLRAVAEAVKAGGSPLHQRLSVFWATPSMLRGDVAGGRLPPLDRLDLLEHGRLLAGEDIRAGLPAPDRDELVVAGADFALDFLGPGHEAGTADTGLGSLTVGGEPVMDKIRHPERLAGEGPRSITKIVLFPVRFLYTAATGRVGTNDAAVAHYVADDAAPARPLVAAGLRWRTTPPGEEEALGLLRRELLPLYRYYLDDHIARLTELNEVDLAAAFVRWRERLGA